MLRAIKNHKNQHVSTYVFSPTAVSSSSFQHSAQLYAVKSVLCDLAPIPQHAVPPAAPQAVVFAPVESQTVCEAPFDTNKQLMPFHWPNDCRVRCFIVNTTKMADHIARSAFMLGTQIVFRTSAPIVYPGIACPYGTGHNVQNLVYRVKWFFHMKIEHRTSGVMIV